MNRMVNRILDRQRWLEPVADVFQKVITGLYKRLGAPGRQLKTLLHGTWLGHPLHPVITDIPLGAWTLAIVFDLIWLIKGTHGWVSAADVTIFIGLLAAVGAAVTGYTDWNETYDRERRVGLAHGLLNTTAIVLYLVSLIIRLSGHGRGLAIVVALLGYAFVIAAAFLGGELVFGIGTGVNHHAFQHQPTKYTPVLPEGALAEGKLHKTMAGATPVLLYKMAGKICAIGETCSHAGGPLSEGKLDGNQVICPWHASRFDVCTGVVTGGPATISQVRYETRVQDGQIEVRVSPETAQPN
ncbi:MAG: Rieske 2Fe-2S domain-containing protein [Candidatus Dormibacteraeota bacterium]|nr:Rieske 2Fe-2S domain-containing protein [Candidatus Dormibacteraeota bacterium]